MFELSVRRVCEEALRKIGAYSINDTAADGEHLRIAINWLDIIMGELSGTTRLFWLVSEPLTLALNVADQKAWPLPASLGSDAPAEGVQFPISAVLVDDDGNRTPLSILRLDQYQALEDPNETGVPTSVYIDRLLEPTLYVHPVPDVATFSIELIVQTFSKTIASDRAVANARAGSDSHGLRLTWQKWAIYELAASLGDGTIRTLAETRLARLQTTADRSRALLLAYENRDQNSEAPQTDFNDL